MPVFTSDVSVDSTVGLTNAELRATPIDINGTFTPSGTQNVNIVSTIPVPITDNAGSITVDGSVSVSGSVTVANPGLTDTQLRATPVPISGTVTATGPLTDTQLRATPVPISGTVSTLTAVANTSTVTLVVTTGSNQTLLAPNANRKRAVLSFESATDYVKLGVGAATNSYTYKITSANTVIEISGWTGQIDMTGTSGKNVLVTELS